jgi:D-arginine dehydrogenase
MHIEKERRIIIVGGGIAGAATAYFLAHRGIRNIVILERENSAGSLSTGRNAAILRSAIPDPVLRGLASQSVRFYQHPPEGFSSHPLLNPVGLYLVARSEHAEALLAWAVNLAGEKGAQIADTSELYRRVPLLAPGVTTAVYDPDEGVLDIHAILHAFLSGACREGAELRLNCSAARLRISGDRVTGVETSAGLLEAEHVVMAGGGYAPELAADAGYPMPMVPCRRHLLVTHPLPQVNPDWPVVWCFGDDFYFRPESRGMLMCACDTVPVSPEEGQRTDPAQIEIIAARASRWLPSLEHAGVARAWAGMRTLAPDDRFVIGPDPRLGGLYWVAALGGHGMTCAPALGQLAAEWVADGTSRHPAAQDLLPARLV